jgi:hypothetical protein
LGLLGCWGEHEIPDGDGEGGVAFVVVDGASDPVIFLCGVFDAGVEERIDEGAVFEVAGNGVGITTAESGGSPPILRRGFEHDLHDGGRVRLAGDFARDESERRFLRVELTVPGGGFQRDKLVVVESERAAGDAIGPIERRNGCTNAVEA